MFLSDLLNVVGNRPALGRHLDSQSARASLRAPNVRRRTSGFGEERIGSVGRRRRDRHRCRNDYVFQLSSRRAMSDSSLLSRFGFSDASIAGFGLTLSGFVGFMGIVTAELLYPEYSTRQDISDLGSTRPPNPVIHEPSATVFNTTMLVTGATVLVSAYLLYRVLDRRGFPIALAVFGFGAFGVGVFPGNVTPWHGLFALLTFSAGGITVVLSSRVVSRPFSLLCGLFGGISLLVLVSVFFYGLVIGGPSPLAPLGPGGIERWVVYPLIMWLPAFGGYLLSNATDNNGDPIRL